MAHIRGALDLRNAFLPPEYSYSSLPLCVIDAVFSIGVRYSGVQRTVANWCDAQVPAWERFRSTTSRAYTIDEFVGLLDRHHSESLAERIFQNRQRTSARNGVLKAEAVRLFAKCLQACGINTFPDIEDPDKVERAETKIRSLPGQGSGLSFTYFLMLSGSDDFVKADRMICRFVAAALGHEVPPGTAAQLVKDVCSMLHDDYTRLTPRLLDYAIWDHQRRMG